MPDFYTVVTDTGLQALGLASTQGQSFLLTHAVVGDGNGLAVVPNKGMTSLVHEVWRGRVAGIKIDPKEPNTYIFEFAIPADTGGFTIREVGLMDESGKLFCIGNFPETEKPVAADGSVRDLVVRLPLHFENVDVVNLVIDPAIVLATKQDVVDHNEDPQAHRLATTAQTGFVRFATDTEHIAHTRKNIAATPWGVWKLLESVMSNACASTSTLRIATSNAVCQVFNRIEAHKTANDPHGIVAKIKELMTSSTTSDSPNAIATSNAVKLVYDALKHHMAAGDPHGVVVKVKALLTSSVTSSSTTTFATPKAVKTVQDNLNAHNASLQSHQMASEGQTGFVRLAKASEHLSSSSARNTIAATPNGVWQLLMRVRYDAVNCDSTYRFATSRAVKTVMDALNGHKSAADPHSSQTRVDSKMSGHLTVNDPHGIIAIVKALLSSSITNASTTTFATPRAVKTVYDHLNTHKSANDPHGIVAKVKALLSSSVTSTSTTLFATPRAVKTAHDKGVSAYNLANTKVNKVNMVVFTSSGTYKKSSKLIAAEVIVTGGGASGGKMYYNGAGGGGGAGTSIKVYSAAEISSSVSVVVGAGGIGNAENGHNGGNSKFLNQIGGGGKQSHLFHSGGAGGTASGGDLNLRGSGGDVGDHDGAGGAGGASYWAGGGLGSMDESIDYLHGYNGSGGAGRDEMAAQSGNGGKGLVVIKEFLKG